MFDRNVEVQISKVAWVKRLGGEAGGWCFNGRDIEVRCLSLLRDGLGLIINCVIHSGQMYLNDAPQGPQGPWPCQV